MSKYGEPWWTRAEYANLHVRNAGGEDIYLQVDEQTRRRIVDCVNALSGLNPAAIKRVVEAAKKASGAKPYTKTQVWAIEELAKSLAALEDNDG